MLNFIAISFAFMIVIGLSMATFGIWVWALFDALTSKKETTEKMLWVLVILFLNLLGAIIYLIAGRSDSAKPLMRSGDKVLFGVCGGIAQRLNIDPIIVRIVWVLFTLMTAGFGLFFYLAVATIMPDVSGKRSWVPGILLIGLVIGMALLVFVGEYAYDEPQYQTVAPQQVPQQIVREVRVTRDSIVEDAIYSSYNYQNYGGHGLRLLSKEMSETCGYDPSFMPSDCYEYMYRFDTENMPVIGFEVIALVINGRIQRIRYDEITMPDCQELSQDEKYQNVSMRLEELEADLQTALSQYQYASGILQDDIDNLRERKEALEGIYVSDEDEAQIRNLSEEIDMLMTELQELKADSDIPVLQSRIDALKQDMQELAEVICR